MRRIDPDEVLQAAGRFAGANAAAAAGYGALRSAVAASGRMAGDDKTSEEFAREYDVAAGDAMTAAAEMVGALAGMARLVYLTGGNHANANLASTYSAHPPELQSCVPPDTTVTVTPYPPPSAVGGDDSDTPPLWDEIADHLEGYTWPGADVASLRTVGNAWKQFRSTVLDSVLPDLDAAVSQLRLQDCPDVDLALDVIAGLRREIDELGTHLSELGNACHDYAQQVEDVRSTVKSVLMDLAFELGLTAVIAGGLTVFTGGTSAAVGGGIAAVRLAAAGRKVVRAFVLMKATVKAGAVGRLIVSGRRVPVLSRNFRQVSEAANRATHAKYLDELRAAMAKPPTKDPELSDIMDRLYRADADIGSGSTAAAIRHELATGKPTREAWHSKKAEDRIRNLERWLRKNPHATHGDRAAAENVIRDMQNALKGQ